MQFLVTGWDGTDADAPGRRAAARQAHLTLGDSMIAGSELLYAAAILDDKGGMIGSSMVLEFPDRAALDSWLEKEPYVTGKVWQKIEVRPCKVGPSFVKVK